MNTYPYSDEGEGDFRRALNWLVDRENVNMVCACGDLSQNGTTTEFAMPQSVIGEVLTTSKNIPFYTCTGNHDVKTAGGNGFGNYFLRDLEKTWNGMTNFERSTGFNESFCFDKTVGDKTDHFIFFSMYSYSLGSSASPYNNADITWLNGKLQAWKNDRVFIFTHLFFPDYAGNLGRVNGSGGIYPSGNWLGGTQLTTLQNMLSSYPNAIWFSGHSHWKWDLQKYQKNLNVEQYGDGAWTVHVPSCALPIDSDYTNTSSETATNRVEKPLESQGGVVYVYADRIEIHGIDFNVNTSQNGSTTQRYEDSTYVRYLPIAYYNMTTVLKTVAGANDPVEGYYIVTSSNKNTSETITKEGDYIIITYTALAQCVGVTNGKLTAADIDTGAFVEAEDAKVIYGGQEIDLNTIQNFGVYMDAASDTGGGSYANFADIITDTGISGASVQEFTWMDSNRSNSETGYGIQLNVSSRFLTANDWIDTLDADHPLILKIKGLRVNGELVNTQSGNIGDGGSEGGDVTYELTTYTIEDINNMSVGESKEVIMANPHRNNGYILGYNGSAVQGSGNGFADTNAMNAQANNVLNNDTYHMIISKKQDTRIDNVETSEDVARKFSVSGTFNNTTIAAISNTTLKNAGYNAYGITSTSLPSDLRTADTTITFDGTEFPRTIYVRLRKSADGATATATISSGGSGTITAVSSTSTTISTNLSNYTAITMTANTLTISTTVKRSSYLQNTGWVILVPNNITEQVTTITPTEVPDGDPYYTLTSKTGYMSPTGTNAAASWSSTPMKFTVENATSLASSSDLTSGVSATSNTSLIRFKNPSNNYLNAGGGASALKFATGTGEWSVWYLFDPASGGPGDYLRQVNFETNSEKGGLDPTVKVRDLSNNYVAVTLDTVSKGFWVNPTNFVSGIQPTLVVEDLQVYSGNMVTSGTTISLPQYVGFYNGSSPYSGTSRYQIADGFKPSYTESGSNGRLQFQTSSSYTGGAITIVMKAKLIYA